MVLFEEKKYRSIGILGENLIKNKEDLFYSKSYDMNSVIIHIINFRKRDLISPVVLLKIFIAMFYSLTRVLGIFLSMLTLLYIFIGLSGGTYTDIFSSLKILGLIQIPIFVVYSFFRLVYIMKKRKMDLVAMKERKKMGFEEKFEIIEEKKWKEFKKTLVPKDFEIFKH